MDLALPVSRPCRGRLNDSRSDCRSRCDACSDARAPTCRRSRDPGAPRGFATASHDRFWWHRLRSTDYVPPLYAGLSRREWAVVQGWFAQTGRRGQVAEINVAPGADGDALVYQDACGLGVLQRVR